MSGNGTTEREARGALRAYEDYRAPEKREGGSVEGASHVSSGSCPWRLRARFRGIAARPATTLDVTGTGGMSTSGRSNRSNELSSDGGVRRIFVGASSSAGGCKKQSREAEQREKREGNAVPVLSTMAVLTAAPACVLDALEHGKQLCGNTKSTSSAVVVGNGGCQLAPVFATKLW